MIYRYFIELSYDGTEFVGWQIQPNGMSVQEKLEFCLSTKLNRAISVTGAGRTDAGVHASFYIAHFDLEEALNDLTGLIHSLNNFLPHSIAIHAIYPVNPDAHARFTATSRTYEYHIHTNKNPFLKNYSWQVRHPLNLELMNQAASLLLQYSDFTSFAKLHTDVKTNECVVSKAIWEEKQDGILVFTIQANRFLRNMVRSIVGTLVDAGKGKINLEQFKEIIDSKDRANASSSAPAQGLFLTQVDYPDWIFDQDSSDKSN